MAVPDRMESPQTPISIRRKPLDSPTRNVHASFNDIPSPTGFSPRDSSMYMNLPAIRMQDTPASPVSISPPRHDIKEPFTATITSYSPASSQQSSRPSSRDMHTPESDEMRDSISNIHIGDRLSSTELQEERSDSRQSYSSYSQRDRLPEDQMLERPEPARLQYHHQQFDDSPVKKSAKRPQMATSMSSSGEQTPHLTLPHAVRPQSRSASAYTFGSDLPMRLHSPVSRSPAGSPRSFSRAVSMGGRRSPDGRPISYIDLLNEVPYAQQVAPSPGLNNATLQMAVGNNASLLDTRKTLEMYRANVKKTNDPAISYEFAMFMINAASDEAAAARSGESGPDAAVQLVKEARAILQKLADRGYPFAQYFLADGYFSGFFSKDKPDYDKAFPLFVAASKHGHAEAGYRTALCYEFGWGCAKAYPKAVQFYRNAASKGHPGAATRLGKACLTDDMGLQNRYREGVKWLKRASEYADFQYNSGPYELGLLHMTGYGDDIFRDEAYAAQLLTQSAELGHLDANFRMGQAYENGILGCPRDAGLSVHFYNGAAMRGMPEAMMALCAWYMVGAEPVLDRDEAEAYEWAKKAAETGFSKAEYAVGYFTEMGIGCRRDALEANVWYVRAADQGNETAKHRLAIIRAAASGDAGIPMSKVGAKSKELGGKEKECVVM